MARSPLGVAWYCYRATFLARWRAYAALVLLIGLTGGLAMASLAAARRTQSSYPTMLAAAHSSQVISLTGIINPLLGSNSGYNAPLVARIARVPHVSRVASQVGLDIIPVTAAGAPISLPTFPVAAGNGLGSVGGEGFAQDRLVVLAGRLADPRRADEIDVDPQVAAAVGWHVGQRIRMGIYTNAQTNLPAFGTASVPPYRVQPVTVVGLAEEPHQVVEDDTDNTQSLAFFTPAFTSPLLQCCTNYAETVLRVSGGPRRVASVVASVSALGSFQTADTFLDVAKAERAVKPESIALGAFGVIAGLAALLISIQLLGRLLRSTAPVTEALRATGAGPWTAAGPGLLGAGLAAAAGAVAAGAVAVALSPLAPLGPVRPAYPYPGVSWDWLVLGSGMAVLLLVLSAAALVISYRSAPHRAATRRRSVGAGTTVVQAAAAGLPAPAVTGIHFAVDPGASDAVPVRSAIFGALLAVVVVVSTVVFGSSLDSLVAKPALYGWNWDYALVAGGASGNMPEAEATRLLDADRYVTAWSGAYFAATTIDGQTVPILGENPGAPVQPPVLSGHGLQGKGQVVLGAATLAQLHKRVGDTVEVATGAGPPARLRIVGTATMPTMGAGGEIHLEMGSGALLDAALIPPADRNVFNDPQPGPEVAFVRVKGGAPAVPSVPAQSGLPLTTGGPAARSLNRIAGQLTNTFNFGVAVSPVLRPAEIVNYRSLGTTPAILGGTLAAGAVTALILTLVASVRRRRRELALLKTLGFTSRQLAATVAWQSSVTVGLGTAIGIPVGIVAGRSLWTLFAQSIHAVPSPAVPGWYMVVIAVGALVLANAVAALPGRMAARTPTGLLLRAQ